MIFIIVYKKGFHYNLEKRYKETFQIFLKLNICILFIIFLKLSLNFINFTSLTFSKLMNVLVFMKFYLSIIT